MIIRSIHMRQFTLLLLLINFMLLVIKHGKMRSKVSTKSIKDNQAPPLRIIFNILIDSYVSFHQHGVIFSHDLIFMKEFSILIIYEPAAAPLSTRNLLPHPLFKYCTFINHPISPWSPAAVPVRYAVIEQWQSSTFFSCLQISAPPITLLSPWEFNMRQASSPPIIK